VTGQDVLSKCNLADHVSNLKGHCPLICCYFEPWACLSDIILFLHIIHSVIFIGREKKEFRNSCPGGKRRRARGWYLKY